jgi:hypothetical protein
MKSCLSIALVCAITRPAQANDAFENTINEEGKTIKIITYNELGDAAFEPDNPQTILLSKTSRENYIPNIVEPPAIDAKNIDQSQPVNWEEEAKKMSSVSTEMAVQKAKNTVKNYETKYLQSAMQMFKNNKKKSKETMEKIKHENHQTTQKLAPPNFFASLFGLITSQDLIETYKN